MFSNIFGSKHSEIIKQATTLVDGELNWGGIVQLCDVASLNEANTKEITQQIGKKVDGKDPNTCLAGLHIVESLFKNGGRGQHKAISADTTLLQAIKKVAAGAHPAPSDLTPRLQRQAQFLIVSFNHFVRHTKSNTLRTLAYIVPKEQVAIYASGLTKEELATSDWTTLTGAGSCGIKGDNKSYQEISPRAPNTEVVYEAAGPNTDESTGASSSSRPPATAPPPPQETQTELAPPPEQNGREPEIQKLWDDAAVLRTGLLWARRASGGLSQDLRQIGESLTAERDSAARLVSMSVNEARTAQLTEVISHMNDVLAGYIALKDITLPPGNLLHAVTGVYEHQGDTNHYVLISEVKGAKQTLQWQDKAGTQWGLAGSTTPPLSMAVAKSCPHHSEGYTTMAITWGDEGVLSVQGPSQRLYTRIGGTEEWSEPEDYIVGGGGVVTSSADDAFNPAQEVGGIN